MDWPEGAASRESIKAVIKLPRLQVCMMLPFPSLTFGTKCRDKPMHMILLCSVVLWQNLVMQHVDHSAGDLIDLLQGLLRYDPSKRLTAREALKHPFFTRDQYRRFL